MKSRIFTLLNIKPSEAGVVKQLFLVQFFLGVATSFLFTSALTLFLATYPIKELPKVSLLAAGLLLIANFVYAHLEAKLSAKKLLQVIVLFSLGSIFFTWLEATFFAIPWLPYFLSAWNLVVYMLVGYAFWGMAAIIFNVRESRRIFSVVGSGDIPAKTIGYAAVAILAPLIGVINVLAVSILAFLVAYYYLNQFNHPAIVAVPDHNHSSHRHGHPSGHSPGLIERYFHNNLIFVIAVWSFIGFTIYSLIDFTFLTEIKVRFKTSHELASFLGIYFAVGRVLAIFLKLLFSSRVINRLGLMNTLLITPAVLLIITSFILIADNSLNGVLLVFGVMVLFSEVLKSAVQEPAFFVLFQPLHPHSRLKGHLITKGFTFPFALLTVSVFAFIFRDANGEISIPLVCTALIILIGVWSAVVFLIKKEYLRTLIQALKKGYFTGTQLFLNDQPVRQLLLAKTESQKPKEVLFALELLERSGYLKIDKLLLRALNNAAPLVKKFVLSRIMHRTITEALPGVRQQLASSTEPEIRPDLIKTLFYLSHFQSREQAELKDLDLVSKKAALLGLAARTEPLVLNFVEQEVNLLASSTWSEEKLLSLAIISEAPHGDFYTSLKYLLQEPTPLIFKTAIETVGKVKEFRLWPETLETALKHNALGALQKSILHFGDNIFSPEFISAFNLPNSFIVALIKTAGNVSGSLSSAYLLEFLRHPEPEFKDLALAALYRKKAKLAGIGEKEVTAWLEVKLGQCKRKITCYSRLASHRSVMLLATTIRSEIKQDLNLILQAFALIYDRQHLERVLQLVKATDDSRISNAIEMLELSIPKRYFLPVDAILEFLLDSSNSNPENFASSTPVLAPAITEIISTSSVGYTIWTKSVALYLIPSLKDKALHKILAAPQIEENNSLFSETKKFVYPKLNYNCHHVIDRKSADLTIFGNFL